MADAPPEPEEGAPTEYVSAGEICEEIARLDLEIRGYTSGAIGAIYRCVTCGDLATNHENANVKQCHPRRKLSGAEWAESVHAQLTSMLAFTEHFRHATNYLSAKVGLRNELETQQRQISDQATAAQNYFAEAEALNRQIAEVKEISAADHAVFAYLL